MSGRVGIGRIDRWQRTGAKKRRRVVYRLRRLWVGGDSARGRADGDGRAAGRTEYNGKCFRSLAAGICEDGYGNGLADLTGRESERTCRPNKVQPRNGRARLYGVINRDRKRRGFRQRDREDYCARRSICNGDTGNRQCRQRRVGANNNVGATNINGAANRARKNHRKILFAFNYRVRSNGNGNGLNGFVRREGKCSGRAREISSTESRAISDRVIHGHLTGKITAAFDGNNDFTAFSRDRTANN